MRIGPILEADIRLLERVYFGLHLAGFLLNIRGLEVPVNMSHG